MKGLAVLGSTGSIGVQTLRVVSEYPEKFQVQVLAAGSNWQLLAEQAVQYQPSIVVIVDDTCYEPLKAALPDHIQVYAGASSLAEVVQFDSVDIVVNGIVGYAGLEPTLKAIEAGKRIALANKETLVIAGEYIALLMKGSRAQLIPVDSEHSAIFQCLMGEYGNEVEKVYLTASGGPFFGMSAKELERVSISEALNHPSWKMGSKISIDSATLINKGFEMIGAKWLFGLESHQMEVIVHPQSVIHSMVQFRDGTIKAQMGPADMRLPILFAMSYPERLASQFPRFNFMDYPELQFREPDRRIFRNLDLAREAMERGGNMPCVLNAANEVAVEAFLQGKVIFSEISRINETILQGVSFIKKPGYSDFLESHEEALAMAKALLQR